MSTLHVLFKVASSEYVLPATGVLHMEAFEGATSVPGTPPWIAGLVQVRGKVVPVVDVRSRFGLDPLAPHLGSRLIVAQVGERLVGLWVDSAREVLHLQPEDFRPPPAVIAEQAGGYVEAVAQAGQGRLVMKLDVQKMIGQGLEALSPTGGPSDEAQLRGQQEDASHGG